MRDWLLQLDELLRGEATSEERLGTGLLNVSARNLAILVVVLAATYGLCMGSFSLLKEVPPELVGSSGRILQMLASMVKVPALFFLTLLVTFPSLYVFNALVGSRLRLLNLLRLLIASLAVNTSVLASLGFIVAFFSISTKSYSFVVLLNVLVFSVSGGLGLMFLLQTMHRMTAYFAGPVPTAEASTLSATALSANDPATGPTTDETVPTADATPLELDDATSADATAAAPIEDRTSNELHKVLSPLDMPEGQVFARHTRTVFRCWLVLFAMVGAQMGWVLRPFIGTPGEPFTLFRQRDSNFFSAVFSTLWNLLSGGG